MSKYMAFGWTNGVDKNGPADELLGTCDTVDYVEQPFKKLPGGGVQFGIGVEQRWVTLAPHLMRGRKFLMDVLVSWGHDGQRQPIIAYYLIPKTGATNG